MSGTLIILAALFFLTAGVFAQLPFLGEKPWVGYFAGVDAKTHQFGITNKARAEMRMFDNRKKELSYKQVLKFDFIVEEEQNGEYRARKIDESSLRSELTQGIVNSEKPVTFTGKVTGGATFEVTLGQNRGDIILGGRIIDKGNARGKLRFSIRVSVPSGYPYQKKSGDDDDRKFERQARRDSVELRLADGSREKLKAVDEFDLKNIEYNKSGITAIAVDFDGFRDRELIFTSSENASFQLWNASKEALWHGFGINWYPDPEKDPDGKARMTIKVK